MGEGTLRRGWARELLRVFAIAVALAFGFGLIAQPAFAKGSSSDKTSSKKSKKKKKKKTDEPPAETPPTDATVTPPADAPTETPPVDASKPLEMPPPPTGMTRKESGNGPPNPYFDEAREMYMNFQFDGIIPKLEIALAVKGITNEQKIEIYKLMAFTHAAFDDAANAQESFIKLLELKADYELTGASPKIRTIFTDAQKTYRARLAVKLEHQPPRANTGGTTTTVDVVATAGADRVATMMLHYRPQGGSGGYSQTQMVRGENGAFSVQVPNVFPGPAGLRTVEYFVRARDEKGGFLAGVGDEEHPLQMQIETVEVASTPVYKSPILWGAVGVAVAAAVAAPFVLRQDAKANPGSLGLETLK